MNVEPGRTDTPSSGELPAQTGDRAAKSGAAPGAAEQPGTAELSKEEQWALFEKELKENDWGHQPC